MNNKNLYIIGNGFDRHHDLDTGYEQYKKYLFDHYKEELDSFSEYVDYITGEEKFIDRGWSEFEKTLTMYHESFMYGVLNKLDDNIPEDEVIDDLNKERSIIARIIRHYFYEWMQTIDTTVKDVKKRLNLDLNSDFVSFNYTDLLERFYNISPKRILHLHGSLDDNIASMTNKICKVVDECSAFEDKEETKLWMAGNLIKEKLVFGTIEGNNDDILYDVKNKYPNVYEWIVESMVGIEKNTTDCEKKLLEFLDNKTYENIYILGHCIDEVDKNYYIDVLLPKYKDANWFITYYSEKEMERIVSFMKKNGTNIRYNLIKLVDLLIIKNED